MALNPDEASSFFKYAEILKRGRFRYVIIGGHAVNTYVIPRATSDVDVILLDDQFQRLSETVTSLIPKTQVKVKRGFASISRKGKKLSDVGFPSSHPLLAATLREATTKNNPALGRILVAPKEHLIALKLLSALSPHRKPHKALQDQADILNLLTQRPNLNRLQGLVAMVRGGSRLLKRLAKMRQSHQSNPRRGRGWFD